MLKVIHFSLFLSYLLLLTQTTAAAQRKSSKQLSFSKVTFARLIRENGSNEVVACQRKRAIRIRGSKRAETLRTARLRRGYSRDELKAGKRACKRSRKSGVSLAAVVHPLRATSALGSAIQVIQSPATVNGRAARCPDLKFTLTSLVLDFNSCENQSGVISANVDFSSTSISSRLSFDRYRLIDIELNGQSNIDIAWTGGGFDANLRVSDLNEDQRFRSISVASAGSIELAPPGILINSSGSLGYGNLALSRNTENLGFGRLCWPASGKMFLSVPADLSGEEQLQISLTFPSEGEAVLELPGQKPANITLSTEWCYPQH